MFPFLSSELCKTLTTLSLRYNSLEDLEGVEILTNLQDLDYSYNLLSKHSILKDLFNLRCLKKVLTFFFIRNMVLKTVFS